MLLLVFWLSCCVMLADIGGVWQLWACKVWLSRCVCRPFLALSHQQPMLALGIGCGVKEVFAAVF